MECNKEEAFRAKDIAEKKMQNKDFEDARKFLLKAQQLYPEMENILQLLSVCDVHCSAAEDKMFGNDKDWYGILQVEQTADDISIKKQYRRFALQLHPDKNQFAGAEAAFKLIGEAQRVLLDKEKRAFHDMKRRTSYKPAPRQPPHLASWNVGVVQQSGPQNNFPNNSNLHSRASNFTNQRQTQQTQQKQYRQHAKPANEKTTFWTLCVHCQACFQYYRIVLGRQIFCPTCKKPFVANDMNANTSGVTQPVFPQQGAPCTSMSNVKPEAKNMKPTGLQAGQKVKVSKSQKDQGKRDERPNVQKANGQRGKKRDESSDSFESDSSLDSEEVGIHPNRSQHFDSDKGRQTRRSNRSKRHVSYGENASDDEQINAPSKKAKENGSTEEKIDVSSKSDSAFEEESSKKECNTEDRHDGVDSSVEHTPESTPDTTLLEYPDPEFCDFDKGREKHCFRVGEIWATYDTLDAMPRFYAKINKNYARGFKLQITWLEADPDDDFGRVWTDLKLPFSCGKFTIGGTELTEDRLMFSHVVRGCTSTGRNSFTIYPKVGETWGIYKNWDAKWCSLSENERKFEYEFVEILSDYDNTVGIRVAPLVKLKGFASLFCRKSDIAIQIQPSEILRFSHMVPSYRTTGNEKKAVPKGSIELDPGSTTMNLEEITVPHLDGTNCSDKLSPNFAGENTPVIVAGISSATHHELNKSNNGIHRNGLK